MMRLRNKLCSQSGASILLALLFFLVCGIVGASILAAASSAVGKVRSRREEQQRYFAMTSALQLICDQLEGAKYTANASVEDVTVSSGDVSNSDPASNYTYKIYSQKAGEFTIENGSNITNVLPLGVELDWLFAETFPPGGEGKFLGDDIYTPLLGSDDVSEPTEHGLVIQLQNLAQPNLNADVEGLKKPIEITVRLGKKDATGDEKEYYKYWMFVTAALRDVSGNVMVQADAELPPTYAPDADSPPHINNPGRGTGDNKTYTVTWGAARIYK